VPTLPQTDGYGQIGMKIPEGSEGIEYDACH